MPAKKKKRAAGRGAGARGSARVRRKKPETLRLRTATPSFTVNDIEKSLAWYRDVLGFTIGETWMDEGKLVGAELKAGKVWFIIGQDDWAKGRDRTKGEGFRMYCTTVQDVDKLAALYKSRGATLTHEPRTQPWGVRDFGVVDPDGFKITIQKRVRRS